MEGSLISEPHMPPKWLAVSLGHSASPFLETFAAAIQLYVAGTAIFKWYPPL